MQPETRTLPRDWRLVTFEETSYWNLPGFPGARVFTCYAFDASVHTHLCEVTPSYCLLPVETFADLPDADEETRERLQGVIDENADREQTYMHVSRVERADVRPLGWTSDPDETDEEDEERVIEYCRGNGVGFIPSK